MSWFKKSVIQQIKEREAKEKEYDSIPEIGKIASPEETEAATINKAAASNSKHMEEVREDSEQKAKTKDDLKLVIETAKIECKLCTNPQGILKVNFDTPTLQNKKTVTVKEKDMKSLLFMGNCTKSPNSSSPCASVMQLGEWKDVGTSKVQDEFPLLLKSTILCNYGGSTIEITDCAQRNEPSEINTAGMPLPENKEIDFDIKLEVVKDKSSFVPFGIPDYNGKIENKSLKFKILITGEGVNHWQLDVKNYGEIIYTTYSNSDELEEVTITSVKSKNPKLTAIDISHAEPIKNIRFWPPGEYIIEWDGFDNNNIYMSKRFLMNNLTASIQGAANQKEKIFETEKIKFERSGVDWVDVLIDNDKKEIQIMLRVNLKDGGYFGANSYEGSKVSLTDIEPHNPVIIERTKTYEDLKKLALEGLEYHWGRNKSHPEGKYVSIDDEQYQVFIFPEHTESQTMDYVDLVYNTNNSWLRSMNPGSIKSVKSFFANVLAQRIVYNVGYIKGDKRWYWFGKIKDIDKDFSYTAAHELGHEILKCYAEGSGGSADYSYRHKGSSDYSNTKAIEDGGFNYPPNGEIDVMKYFNNAPNWYNVDFKRIIAEDKDVLGLIWLTKVRSL